MTDQKLYTCIAVSLFSLLLFSCETKKNQSILYFPVDSLMHAQVDFLVESKAVLTKKATIDGSEETNSFTPKNTTAWSRELDIFAELNTINKPINSGNYKIEYGLQDPNSNLTIRSFTSIRKSPIVYMRILYLQVPSRIRRIEALQQEENSLLKSSRTLIMEFQEVHNKTVLTSYSIEGGQKMFLGDSVQFSIKGTITLP